MSEVSLFLFWGFPSGSVVKNPPANAGDTEDSGLIHMSKRSSGGGSGNPHQYSCLENPMNRGTWLATVHGMAKSQTSPSNWARIHIPILEMKKWNSPKEKFLVGSKTAENQKEDTYVKC